MKSAVKIPSATQVIELDVSGMTCASCANRIEKKLNRMDGVSASVNYATEKAQVSYAETTTPADLIATIEKTGYGATLPAESTRDTGDEVRRLRTRLIISAVGSVPVPWCRRCRSLPGSGSPSPSPCR